MMCYILVLALELMFLYTLRDGLLILQRRRDEKLAEQERKLKEADTTYIIQQSSPQCKQFERAS